VNGGALDLSWAQANAAANLEAWYPGQAGGQALGEVLAGRAGTGGRLLLTFRLTPRDLGFVNAAGERRLIPGRYRATVGSG
jgi:beta-glucosidase